VCRWCPYSTISCITETPEGLVPRGHRNVATCMCYFAQSVDFPQESLGSNFALFGRSQITEYEVFVDGIDLFAARLSAFNLAMESMAKHYKLKNDLVQHINQRFNT
jgi:hypothetical protein